MKQLKIGIIREGKLPPDNRVPFTPAQCALLLVKYPTLEITVQPSPFRCFSDNEYKEMGIAVNENLSDCDILMGIKEVPKKDLIAGKTYIFFSHVIKKQPHNKDLLKEIIRKKITLIDYECLTWEKGERILGFGHYAGVVGAHNGLLTWGRRTGAYSLKPAHECFDYKEMLEQYKKIRLPDIKIVVTGTGRVAKGVFELLDALSIKKTDPESFLKNDFNVPVYVSLGSQELYQRKDGGEFNREEFHHHPGLYAAKFLPYAYRADMMINAVYWSEEIPRFFTKADMRRPEFKIKVIADISCDIDGAVPATIRDTIISDPVFGYDAAAEKETAPYLPGSIDIMAVSNLPNELPREASAEFGNDLHKYIIDELLAAKSDIIRRASIVKDGILTKSFMYLKDYVEV